jgi:hypothetical protein
VLRKYDPETLRPSFHIFSSPVRRPDNGLLSQFLDLSLLLFFVTLSFVLSLVFSDLGRTRKINQSIKQTSLGFILFSTFSGVWCADRAALLLMIRIDKLKTREKYERHFLLLSLVFTLMVRVRKWCDDTFGSLTEPTKLSTFARPKAGSTCSTFFVSVVDPNFIDMQRSCTNFEHFLYA